MILIIMTVITASSYCSTAKKYGVSRIKWTIIGILVAIIPLTSIPPIVMRVTGREDLDIFAFMGAVVFVIIFRALLKKLIKPKEKS